MLFYVPGSGISIKIIIFYYDSLISENSKFELFCLLNLLTNKLDSIWTLIKWNRKIINKILACLKMIFNEKVTNSIHEI